MAHRKVRCKSLLEVYEDCNTASRLVVSFVRAEWGASKADSKEGGLRVRGRVLAALLRVQSRDWSLQSLPTSALVGVKKRDVVKSRAVFRALLTWSLAGVIIPSRHNLGLHRNTIHIFNRNDTVYYCHQI